MKNNSVEVCVSVTIVLFVKVLSHEHTLLCATASCNSVNTT